MDYIKIKMISEDWEEMNNKSFEENNADESINLEEEKPTNIPPLVDFDKLYNMKRVSGQDKILAMIELGKNHSNYYKTHPSTTVRFWKYIIKRKGYGKILKGMKPATLKKYYSMIRKCDIEKFTECLLVYKSSYDKCNSIKEIIKHVIDDMINIIFLDVKKKDNVVYDSYENANISPVRLYDEEMFEDHDFISDIDNNRELDTISLEFFPSYKNILLKFKY